MQLSKHFTLGEFIISTTATRRCIDNDPSDEVIYRLKLLANNVLEPVREHFGVIHILSGFRCEELNKRIGGAKSSQHIFGEASDIMSHCVTTLEIAEWVRDNIHSYDQCIYEGKWVHISHSNRHTNRKVDLTAIFAKNERTRYVSGIVDLAK